MTGNPTRRDFIRAGVAAGLARHFRATRRTPATPAETADLILHNGRIATMDPRHPFARPWPSRAASSSPWEATARC